MSSKLLQGDDRGFERRGDNYCPGIMLLLHLPLRNARWKSTVRTTGAVSIHLLEGSCINRIDAVSSTVPFLIPQDIQQRLTNFYISPVYSVLVVTI